MHANLIIRLFIHEGDPARFRYRFKNYGLFLDILIKMWIPKLWILRPESELKNHHNDRSAW